MAIHDDNAVRINNLRPSSQTKEILREIREYRISQGQKARLNDLFDEAVREYYKPELAKIRKLRKDSKVSKVKPAQRDAA